ncbi:hypothetical protein GCM10009550_03820 [Actinocorallia libanotica]|uniref:Uncharacterized protein n=2 Tax=Actinocorallia libanotica TaxID=46162 RepID=A0ABN1Q3K2_9ACTN
MTAPVLRPARLFHAFLSAGHVLGSGDRTPARDAAEALWRRTASLAGGEGSAELRLAGNDTFGFDVLGRRERTLPLGFHEALAYRLHGVVGISVMEAPNDDSFSWEALNEPWQSDLEKMPEGVFGSAQIHLGLIGAEDWHRFLEADGGAEALGRELYDGVPDAGEPGWTRSWFQPFEGALVWELPPFAPGVPADRLPHARRFLAVARESHEEALDTWLWSPVVPGLAPFTRYLLHAAKLRYQSTVLRSALPGLRTAVEGIDLRCAALAELTAERTASVKELVEADQAISRLQTDQNGLIERLTRIRDLAASVRAAQRNMTAALDDGLAESPGGPLALDQETAGWTLEQLQIEETYLASAQTKTAETARVTALVVSARLQRLRENLVLFHATLLGALVTVLTAVQSLEYDPPLPQRLEAPLIALLGAVALLLPPAVVRWPRGGPGGVDRWARLDHVLAGLPGAALGWLAISAMSLAWSAKGASPGQSAGAAVLGALLAIGAGRLLFQRSHLSAVDRRRQDGGRRGNLFHG